MCVCLYHLDRRDSRHVKQSVENISAGLEINNTNDVRFWLPPGKGS